MERLTQMSDGYYAVGSADCWEDQNEEYSGPAIDRLAAYEDIGLEPEEVANGLKAIRQALALSLELQVYHEIGTHDHLRELVQAEKEGRLVMLPCKVGEPAHWVHNDTITDCKISRIQINRNGLYICLRSKVSHGAFRIESIGRNIFLTREEAEAALDAQKGGKTDA